MVSFLFLINTLYSNLCLMEGFKRVDNGVPAHDQKPDAPKPFIVRDGMLVSLGKPRGHLLTDKQFSNYRLQVEYRFAGRPGNCGVLVHASRLRNLYKMYPKSIEVQMNHQHAGDFWCIVEDIKVTNMEKRRGPKKNWGVTEGKARRILNLTDGSENPVGEWNAMTIECKGRSPSQGQWWLGKSWICLYCQKGSWRFKPRGLRSSFVSYGLLKFSRALPLVLVADSRFGHCDCHVCLLEG